MILKEDEKWQAVVECDECFDGQFFYGVKTTGIFCKPSCKSKTPLRSNVEFFDNGEAASSYGFRPCKRCRPDLLQYNPNIELIEKAKKIYDMYFYDSDKLRIELKKLGISQSHLSRLFQTQYGTTPMEYMNKLRINKAAILLSEANMNILNVANECGFGSLSAFYHRFKKSMGCTPSEYRKD